MSTSTSLTWSADALTGTVGSPLALGTLTLPDYETLQSLIIDGIPDGATLSDGANSFLAGPDADFVDVSGWNLATLTITVPTAESFTLTAVATTQDLAGVTTITSATDTVSVTPLAATLEATTSTAVTTPTYDDGSANAPAGTPQLAGLLSSYVVRPPWEVAGVDYAVGVPTGMALADPTTISMPGVVVDTALHFVVITASNVTLNGYDFSGDGGWGIVVATGVTNTVITNCNFLVGGDQNVPIDAADAAGNLTVEDDTFNGGSSGSVFAMIAYSGTGVFTAKYDSFSNTPEDAIDFGSGTMTTIVEYTTYENLGTEAGAHADTVQYNGTDSIDSLIAFNTVVSGEEGIQLAAQDGSTLTDTTIDNNVIIAGPLIDGVDPQMSYSIAVQQLAGNSIDGVVVDDNYIDASNAYGPFYTPTGSDLTFSGNVDLTSGVQFASPPGTASNDVTSVTVSPSGGTVEAGSTITISLNMDEVESVSGTPTLSLNNGGTATYESGSGTDVLTFDYTVGLSATPIASLAITAVNLPANATVTDNLGNQANLTGALVTFTDPVISSAGEARTLVWNGSDGSVFSEVANWTDITSGTAEPATAAPTSVDTVDYLLNAGGITGDGAAGSMTFDSGGAWQIGDAHINVAGTVTVGLTSATELIIGGVPHATATLIEGDSAIIANTSTASNSLVEVTGTASSWQINGALIVGDAGLGELSIAQGGSVSAASAAEATASGGDGVIVVSGTGSALSLTGSLTVGSQAAGEVSVLGGGTLTAGDLFIGSATATSSGNVDVEGAGSTLNILAGGSLNVGVAGGGSGVLTIGTNATLNFNGTIVEAGHASFNNNGGTIDPDAVQFTSDSNAGVGLNLYDLYVENLGAVQISDGTGIWDAAMLLTGSSVADAAGNIGNGDVGAWQLSSGGTLVINANTVDAGQAIVFEDDTDTLVIGQVVNGGSAGIGGQTPTVLAGAENLLQAGGFQAEIWGYQAGDRILFDNLDVTSDQILNGNTLELLGVDGTDLGSLTFFTKAGNKPLGTTAMAAAAQQMACFAAGTLIETPDGPRAVETLAVGDEVVTLLGGPGRIVWVGSRAVDCARHPRPEAVWPVRIAAGAFGQGAFGENVPARDLLVSPDHAIYVDSVLIPAKHLVNGTTICQVPRRRVVYHHVELERHDVVLAEGLPAETYLDTGDRTKFSGSQVIALHPDFSACMWEAMGCAPLIVTGPQLATVRHRIDMQAKATQGHRSGARLRACS